MDKSIRCDNVAHEIISALRNETEKEIERVKSYAHKNNIPYLSNVYKKVVQCRYCFIKDKCSEKKFCYEVISDYMEGDI